MILISFVILVQSSFNGQTKQAKAQRFLQYQISYKRSGYLEKLTNEQRDLWLQQSLLDPYRSELILQTVVKYHHNTLLSQFAEDHRVHMSRYTFQPFWLLHIAAAAKNKFALMTLRDAEDVNLKTEATGGVTPLDCLPDDATDDLRILLSKRNLLRDRTLKKPGVEEADEIFLRESGQTSLLPERPSTPETYLEYHEGQINTASEVSVQRS